MSTAKALALPRPLVLLLLSLQPILGGCRPQTVSPSPAPSPIALTPTPTVHFPTLVPTPTEGVEQDLDLPTFPFDELPQPSYLADFQRETNWQEVDDAFGAVSSLDTSLFIVLSVPSATRFVPSPADPSMDFLLDASLSSVVCSGDDEYGVAFRYTPQGDHLRFTVTCSGQVRLRAVRAGSSRAVVPFLEAVQAARAGAPVTNRFTVGAQGRQLTLWLNGSLLLQAQDSAPTAGTLGLFVSSSRNTLQTTVQADSFAVYPSGAIPTLAPTATESRDE